MTINVVYTIRYVKLLYCIFIISHPQKIIKQINKYNCIVITYGAIYFRWQQKHTNVFAPSYRRVTQIKI